MFLSSIVKISSFRGVKRSYRTMPPSNYIVNQRDSNNTKKIHMTSLFPLKNANHGEGTTDEIELFGVPYGNDTENPKERDIFMRSLDRNRPDLIFL